jgi:UDP-N-acetylglucosamine 2-epimerase (non-hydrolysing)
LAPTALQTDAVSLAWSVPTAMKVLSIFGTRPDAIKMAPLVRAMQESPAIRPTVCVTGQHRQMLDQVLRLFAIVPDYDLGLMTRDQTLNGLAGRALVALDDILNEVRPDRVLVHGDTTTAMAAALAAFHRRIPVGHVEAGLRTHDISRPWPEEMNRRVVDVMSDLLFAPTTRAKANLAAERLSGRIVVTGNTVIDALKLTVARISADVTLRAQLDAQFSYLAADHKLLLVTGHRRESFGAGFLGICAALGQLSRRSDIDIVYPVHLNPNVQGPVLDALSGCANLHLIEPLDYVPFVYLMQRAHVVLTDSGGVQEEAPSLGKPVLVMRDVTERPEAIDAGTVELVGTDPTRIITAVTQLFDDIHAHQRFARSLNPYGDGTACDRIVATLVGRPVHEFTEKPSSSFALDRIGSDRAIAA